MEVLQFIIDKKESEEKNALAISILTNPKNAPAGLAMRISNPADKAALEFLIAEESKSRPRFNYDQALSLLHVPYAKSSQAIRLLAATGKLFLDGKQLVCDLFGKTELYLEVQEDCTVRGIITYRDTRFDMKECSFVSGGPPCFFVKGINLKFLPSYASWKLVKKLFYDLCGKEVLPDEEEEELKVVYKGSSKEAIQQAAEPFPILVLCDRTGAFANLMMDYGTESLLFDPNAIHKNGRQIEAEKSWEKDLLETDYKRRRDVKSHYYCPLDKVAKSLSFLLEIGWHIIDMHGNKVIRHNKITTDISADNDRILVRGAIDYGSHRVDLQSVAGAFNRREKFIELGAGQVGLLDADSMQKNLSGLEEGELVDEGISFSKNKIGVLSDLISCSEVLSPSLLEAREMIANFRGLESVQAGGSFTGKLRPYQQAGLDWLQFLYKFHFNGILADDMGLGKTVQTLAFLSSLKDRDAPSLIVAPTSLLFNWKSEIQKFLTGEEVLVHQGKDRMNDAKDMQSNKLIITSYATLRQDFLLFQAMAFQCLVLDEAQAIKNPSSQIAQITYQLNARFKLCITGTPIENNLIELWSHFRFLMPTLLEDRKLFEANAQAAALDARHLQRIRKKIRPFILRRKKEEVAKDLPEKIEQTIWLEMGPDHRKFYDDFLAKVKQGVLSKANLEGVKTCRMEVLESILRLRQICCHPILLGGEETAGIENDKEEALLADLQVIIAEGGKVLIYSQFTGMLNRLAKLAYEQKWKFSYLDGSTKDREGAVKQFQEDQDTRLFFISLKAGGVGLNLTAADFVILYDPWWNEAVENQAISRAHRIGREKTVIAKRFAFRNSIEEKIMQLKKAKTNLVNEILEEGDFTGGLTDKDLLFLLE